MRTGSRITGGACLMVALSLAGACGESEDGAATGGTGGTSAGKAGAGGKGASGGTTGGSAGTTSGGSGGKAGATSGGKGGGASGGNGASGGSAGSGATGTGGTGTSGGAGAGGESGGGPTGSCPAMLPESGAPCADPGLTCLEGECPDDFEVVVAICVRSAWLVSETVCDGCCQSDDDCQNQSCVAGYCQPAPSDGCFRDDHCPEGEICSAPWLCPCGYDCQGYDQAGTCVPDNRDCCRDDGECTGGPCVKGMCKPSPGDGCWSDLDCQGVTCVGAQVCACGTECLVEDSLGTCMEI